MQRLLLSIGMPEFKDPPPLPIRDCKRSLLLLSLNPTKLHTWPSPVNNTVEPASNYTPPATPEPLCVRELAVRRPTLLSNARIWNTSGVRGRGGWVTGRFNSLILGIDSNRNTTSRETTLPRILGLSQCFSTRDLCFNNFYSNKNLIGILHFSSTRFNIG